MPCYDRTREDSEHLKRRIALVRRNFNHQEIDAIFENEIYENMSWKQLKQKELELEKSKEEFELEKKNFESQIQETIQEAEDKKAEIIQETELRKKLFDSSGLGVISRKVQLVVDSAEKQGLTDETLCLFLYYEDGCWKSTSGFFRAKAEELLKKLGDS
jgi:hypothetical protein